MAEGTARKRRAVKYAAPPERVSTAAEQMQGQAYGQPRYASFPPDSQGSQGRPVNGMTPQEQAFYEQQYYEQQAMQQEYARQQYAWQQEQIRLQQEAAQKSQRRERERVSSETASHGAFRGYTQEIPVQGGPGPGQAEPPRGGSGALRTILIIAAVLLIGAAAGIGIPKYLEIQKIQETVAAYDGLFAEGVYVDGIHLGGMSPEQGLNSVQSQIQQRKDAWTVTLTYQGTQMAQINAGMLGMSVDIGQVLNEAWAQGHTGDVNERYAAMQALKETPYQAYTAVPSGDTSVIDNVLTQVKNQIDMPAMNARLLEFNPEQSYPFSFQTDQKGRRLDTEKIRENLYHMVATLTSGTVELQPEIIEPDILLTDLQRHYMLRSSVYTPISTSSEENRNNNIRHAFEFINGYVLAPGAQFSFNGVVGERTESNGFFPAIEYAYGEHVMGIGGGVCQASTTVYQAAVCAGLQIVKREPHSDSVNYTEYGKDATVYWVGKRKIDLVFKNNTENPIYMVAAVQKDPSNRRRLIAKVMIYGDDMGDERYEIECKTVRELDPPEKPSYIKDKEGTYVTYTDQQKSVSKAKPGYVVESYRVRYSGNTEIDRTMLYTDTYEPKPERIYVGVKRRDE